MCHFLAAHCEMPTIDGNLAIRPTPELFGTVKNNLRIKGRPQKQGSQMKLTSLND
jgi:hypothetical protein